MGQVYDADIIKRINLELDIFRNDFHRGGIFLSSIFDLSGFAHFLKVGKRSESSEAS